MGNTESRVEQVGPAAVDKGAEMQVSVTFGDQLQRNLGVMSQSQAQMNGRATQAQLNEAYQAGHARGVDEMRQHMEQQQQEEQQEQQFGGAAVEAEATKRAAEAVAAAEQASAEQLQGYISELSARHYQPPQGAVQCGEER